jgi:hypothetical protein
VELYQTALAPPAPLVELLHGGPRLISDPDSLFGMVELSQIGSCITGETMMARKTKRLGFPAPMHKTLIYLLDEKYFDTKDIPFSSIY